MLDLTEDDVVAEDVRLGKKFHCRDGISYTGVYEPKLQEATFSKNGTFYPEDTYDGFASVTIDLPERPQPEFGSGERGGVLRIVENGVYDHSYETESVIFNETTEYDFSITINGTELQIKKVDNFTVPESIIYLTSPEYAITLKYENETEEARSFNDVQITEIKNGDNETIAYCLENIPLAFCWVKDANSFIAYLSEMLGLPESDFNIFEDNSAYGSDYLFKITEDPLLEIVYTAPGKKLNNISSAEVAVTLNLEELPVYSNGEYNPPKIDGVDGFSKVIVDVPPPPLTNKTITPTKEEQVFSLAGDDRYYGYGEVTVEAIPDDYIKPTGTVDLTLDRSPQYFFVNDYERAKVTAQLETATANTNGIIRPQSGYCGLSQVTVDVKPNLPDRTLVLSSDDTILPTASYDGLSAVTVKVNHPVQAKAVQENGEILPDEGYCGLSKVTVNVQPVLQEITLTTNGEVTPDEGYDGFSKVTVQIEDSAQPIEIRYSTQMSQILEQANSDSVGQIYKYTGQTTENFESGALYIIEEV
jgi:hypothetical protein